MMKKREKKSIIIGFVLSVLVFGGLIFGLLNIYPQFIEIEDKKNKVEKEYDKYNNIKEKGLSYSGFINFYENISENNEIDNEIKKILEDKFFNNKVYSNLDENFYNKAIFNSGSYSDTKNINQILETNNKILTDKLQSSNYKKQKLSIQTVLPIYSGIGLNNNLTNLDFIKYMESILDKYDLSYKGDIGIKTLKSVENNYFNKDDNIYYFVISLKLNGTKKNILNFIKYLEVNPQVKIDNQDIKFLGKPEQLSEIKSIKLQKYIDDNMDISRKILKGESLYSYLNRTNQGNDYIDTDMEIKFYVDGVGKDNILIEINKVIGKELKEFIFDDDGNKVFFKDKVTGESTKIQKFILYNYNYTNLLNLVKKLQKNKDIQNDYYAKQKINSIYKYLINKALIKDISSIKKEIYKTNDINNIYQKTLKYKEIFSKLNNEIYSIIDGLELNKDLLDDNGKIKQKSILPLGYTNN